MTNQPVSFEVAQLILDKGIKVPIDCVDPNKAYNNKEFDFHGLSIPVNGTMYDSNLIPESSRLHAPFQDAIQKILRDEFGVITYVKPKWKHADDTDAPKYIGYVVSDAEAPVDERDTWEEALDDALLAALSLYDFSSEEPEPEPVKKPGKVKKEKEKESKEEASAPLLHEAEEGVNPEITEGDYHPDSPDEELFSDDPGEAY